MKKTKYKLGVVLFLLSGCYCSILLQKNTNLVEEEKVVDKQTVELPKAITTPKEIPQGTTLIQQKPIQSIVLDQTTKTQPIKPVILEDDWWKEKDDDQIKQIVQSSLVFKNEWTNEQYYGLDQLQFGFNKEDQVYGGLKLIRNPYQVQFEGYQFIGGLQFLPTNTFKAYYQSPDCSKEVFIKTFTVKKPPSITASQLYEFYHS